MDEGTGVIGGGGGGRRGGGRGGGGRELPGVLVLSLHAPPYLMKNKHTLSKTDSQQLLPYLLPFYGPTSSRPTDFAATFFSSPSSWDLPSSLPGSPASLFLLFLPLSLSCSLFLSSMLHTSTSLPLLFLTCLYAMFIFPHSTLPHPFLPLLPLPSTDRLWPLLSLPIYSLINIYKCSSIRLPHSFLIPIV